MRPQVLLLDIEGTTTPISFVHDVLFPYAREHVEPFLRRAWADPGVAADRVALAAEMSVDSESLPQLVGAVARLMDNDTKSTALKSLQGKIWRQGYIDGSLRGEVFDDVGAVFDGARAAGLRICIYSSGSIAAQQLLFGHSTAGDLTQYIDGYFDTTTGPKKETASYTKIAEALAVPASDVLFCTDSLDEATAAAQARMRVAILDRPGNSPLGSHGFETWQSLEPVHAMI